MEEGGAKIFGVFRVENHDFTPKNHIFSNFRGGARRVRPPGSASGYPRGLLVHQKRYWHSDSNASYVETFIDS